MPTTRKLRTVTRAFPMCPDMRMPGNTREGNADEPIEPGDLEHRSVRLRPAREVVPLDHAGEAASLADADDVHVLLALEDVHQDAVADLDRLRRGAVTGPVGGDAHLAQEAAPAAGRACSGGRARACVSRDSLTNSTSPICTAS